MSKPWKPHPGVYTGPSGGGVYSYTPGHRVAWWYVDGRNGTIRELRPRRAWGRDGEPGGHPQPQPPAPPSAEDAAWLAARITPRCTPLSLRGFVGDETPMSLAASSPARSRRSSRARSEARSPPPQQPPTAPGLDGQPYHPHRSFRAGATAARLNEEDWACAEAKFASLHQAPRAQAGGLTTRASWLEAAEASIEAIGGKYAQFGLKAGPEALRVRAAFYAANMQQLFIEPALLPIIATVIT